MTVRAFARILLLALLGTSGSTSMSSLARAEPPPAVRPSSAPRPATPAEAKRYAEREEKAAPELRKFEGGQVVIVLGTTAAIVLAVLLVILIL